MGLTDWEDVTSKWFDENKSNLPDALKNLSFDALKKLVDAILAKTGDAFKDACKVGIAGIIGKIEGDGDDQLKCQIELNGKGIEFETETVGPTSSESLESTSLESSFGIVTNVSIGLTI